MKRPHRRGLSLLELVIVLVILTALAGIVIPLLPNLLKQTHIATCTTNISELNKAVLTYAALNFGHPDNYDSLIETGSTTDAYAGLEGIDATSDPLSVGTVPTGGAASLAAIGIENVVDGDAITLPGDNATFDYGGTIRPIADGGAVLRVTGQHVLDVFSYGNPAALADTFVVFGIGPNCDIVGEPNAGIFEAPVYVAETQEGNPANEYARFVVVYDVSTESATFVGAAALHDGELEGVAGHLEEFYE